MSDQENKMPLSEAIRLGATLRPQATGSFISEIGSCALGAAAEAAGLVALYCLKDQRELGDVDDEQELGDLILERWRLTLDLSGPHRCPCRGCVYFGTRVMDLVVHLNDRHFMSREEIADHVEKFELARQKKNVERKEEVTA